MRAKVQTGKDSERILRVFQSRDETRAFYDRISRVYDLLAERSEQPIRSAALKKLNPQPGENLLEVGFGTGHCLADMACAVGGKGKVFGIDLSEGMLEEARTRLSRAGLMDRVGLGCADATRLPLRTAVMDGIFMSFTLELFDTPEIPSVLSECRRVLKPAGRLAVVSMSKEGDGSALVHAFEWTHKHFPRYVDCRPIFARKALESAGFRVASAEIRKMWIPVEVILALRSGA